MSDQILNSKARDIWREVKIIDPRSVDKSYDFIVSPNTRETLQNIIKAPFPSGVGMELNRSIRSSVNKILIAQETDNNKAAELYKWIVADWGGIRAGHEQTTEWANRWHHRYTDQDLIQFADQQGMYRVSSWSKIFAFAAPKRHAIYDSRVAVALNIALCKIHEKPLFFMPPSQNNIIKKAKERLDKIKCEKVGYRSYINLVGKINNLTKIPVLDIEATLFASAIKLAENFLDRSNTVAPSGQ